MSESTKFATGAVRSADTQHLDFTSAPLLGFMMVAATAGEGAQKYGRFNYMQGMPVDDTLNHAIRHIFMFLMGDRSEPHLEHAGWGVLNAIQTELLMPEVSASRLLGPGMTIPPAMRDEMDRMAPILAAKRKAGEFAGLGSWSAREIAEVQTILGQRQIKEAEADLTEAFQSAADIEAQTPITNANSFKVTIRATYNGKTKWVPRDIRVNNQHVNGDHYDHVLLIARPEHEHAMMCESLRNKRVLCVDRDFWNEPADTKDLD